MIKIFEKPEFKQKLRVVCWNKTSWNNRNQQVIIELNKHKINALSEIKKRGKGNTRYQNYILFCIGKDKNERAQNGVGNCVTRKTRDAYR